MCVIEVVGCMCVRVGWGGREWDGGVCECVCVCVCVCV